MCFSIEDKDLLVKTHQLGNCLLGRWWLGQGGGVGAPRWEGETSSGCESGMNNIYWGTQVLGWWSLVMSTVIIFLVWTDRNVKFTFCPDSKAVTTQLCQIRLEQRVYSWGVMSGIDMETLSTIKAWWNTLYLQKSAVGNFKLYFKKIIGVFRTCDTSFYRNISELSIYWFNLLIDVHLVDVMSDVCWYENFINISAIEKDLEAGYWLFSSGRSSCSFDVPL